MSEALRPHVVAVNVVAQIRRGPRGDTAIDKRPVSGPVAVGELGLEGDRQCDTRYHGGPDKALYAYASEDAEWWSAQLGREVGCGLFGENLTTCGIDVSGALIGERWQIGARGTGALVEVRMPRTPCENLSARMGIPRFHQLFAASGRVGAYLKVLSAGSIAAADPIAICHRPDHGVTIADWVLNRTPDAARRLLSSDIDLAAPVRSAALRVARGGRERSMSRSLSHRGQVIGEPAPRVNRISIQGFQVTPSSARSQRADIV